MTSIKPAGLGLPQDEKNVLTMTPKDTKSSFLQGNKILASVRSLPNNSTPSTLDFKASVVEYKAQTLVLPKEKLPLSQGKEEENSFENNDSPGPIKNLNVAAVHKGLEVLSVNNTNIPTTPKPKLARTNSLHTIELEKIHGHRPRRNSQTRKTTPQDLKKNKSLLWCFLDRIVNSINRLSKFDEAKDNKHWILKKNGDVEVLKTNLKLNKNINKKIENIFKYFNACLAESLVIIEFRNSFKTLHFLVEEFLEVIKKNFSSVNMKLLDKNEAIFNKNYKKIKQSEVINFLTLVYRLVPKNQQRFKGKEYIEDKALENLLLSVLCEQYKNEGANIQELLFSYQSITTPDRFLLGLYKMLELLNYFVLTNYQKFLFKHKKILNKLSSIVKEELFEDLLKELLFLNNELLIQNNELLLHKVDGSRDFEITYQNLLLYIENFSGKNNALNNSINYINCVNAFLVKSKKSLLEFYKRIEQDETIEPKTLEDMRDLLMENDSQNNPSEQMIYKSLFIIHNAYNLLTQWIVMEVYPKNYFLKELPKSRSMLHQIGDASISSEASQSPGELIKLMIHLLEKYIDPQMIQSLQKQLSSAVDKQKKVNKSDTETLTKNRVLEGIFNIRHHLNDIQNLANQWILLSRKLISNVDCSEIFIHTETANIQNKSPSWHAYMQYYSMMTNFVIETILYGKIELKNQNQEYLKASLKDTYDSIEFYIHLLKNCLTNQDFFTANAIYLALESPYITPFIEANAHLQELLKPFKKLFSPLENHKNLRNEILQTNPQVPHTIPPSLVAKDINISFETIKMLQDDDFYGGNQYSMLFNIDRLKSFSKVFEGFLKSQRSCEAHKESETSDLEIIFMQYYAYQNAKLLEIKNDRLKLIAEERAKRRELDLEIIRIEDNLSLEKQLDKVVYSLTTGLNPLVEKNEDNADILKQRKMLDKKISVMEVYLEQDIRNKYEELMNAAFEKIKMQLLEQIND